MAARLGVPRGLTLAEWFERTGQAAETGASSGTAGHRHPQRDWQAAAVLFRESLRASCAGATPLPLCSCAGYGRLHGVSRGTWRRRRRYRRARSRSKSQRAGAGRHYVQRAETKRERRGARAVTTASRRRRSCPRCRGRAARAGAGGVPGQAPSRRPRLRASIVSIELARPRRLDRPMAGLRETEVEWVFDRAGSTGARAPQHVAFIVSAAVRSAPGPRSWPPSRKRAAPLFREGDSGGARAGRSCSASPRPRVRPGGGRDRPGETPSRTVPGR